MTELGGVRECVGWLALGGAGHFIWDLVSYPLVALLGAKLGSKYWPKCRHGREG